MDLDAVPVKILDPATVRYKGSVVPDFESRIDVLSRLFNPWRTPATFLPYLASWVALDLRSDWTEYQQRKLISEIVGIYQQRGLKQGIYTTLDIYAVSAARPRVVIDDNDAVLHAIFSDDGTAVLRAVAHTSTVSPASDASKTVTALMHPTGIAVDSQNSYFVCDPGNFGYSLAVPRTAALWKLSPNGDMDFVTIGAITTPKAVASGPPLVKPTAVAADSTDQISIVDTGVYATPADQHSSIFRFAPPAYAFTTVISPTTVPPFPAVHPVAMVLDGAGRFVVLDRGFHPFGNPPSGAVSAKIVVVSEGPLAVATHPLASIGEPTALIMDSAGRFIVADAQLQSTATPADLVLVDPGAGWTATSLLGAVADNPLIFPTGMVWESPSVLLVCDTGVRWGFVTDQSNRTMAEAPAIFRVDLSQAPPRITRVTRQRQLVRPTAMGRDRSGRVLTVDAGEFPTQSGARSWRAGANEFGAVVLFSNQRPTSGDQRNKYRRGIIDVINTQTPAHTAWWMDF
jgi:phage tail-like protein